MVNPRTKKMGPSIPASAQNWRARALFKGGRSGFVVPGIIVAPLACAYDIVQSAFPPDMPPLGVSISNPAFCTLSDMGGLTDVLMRLHMQTHEKGCEVGNVSPLAQSFLVSISSRMLVWLSKPIRLLSVHVSRFDMLTPSCQLRAC